MRERKRRGVIGLGVAVMFGLLLAAVAEAQGPPEPITLRSVKGSTLTSAEADDDIENLLHLFTGADKDSVASSVFSLYLPGETTVTATDCDAAGEANQIRVDEGTGTIAWCSGAGGWIFYVPASSVSSDATMSDTGALTIAANAVALGTDTTGGYAASTTEGGGATSLEAGAVDATTELAGALCGTNEILEDQGASWACVATPAGGGTPGGSDTEIQYNNGGAFGGVSTLTHNGSTGLVAYAPTLDEATGEEIALDVSYTVNKATSGDDIALRLNMTDTASPGISYFLQAKRGGSTRFYVNSAGSAQFGTSGAVPIVLAEVATATNPIFTSASDLSTGVSPQADEVSIVVDGDEVIRAEGATSAVNYVSVTPAAAAAAPAIAPGGTDANIDLSIAGKGSGTVLIDGCLQHGKHSAAPSGAECDSYWDTDINLRCWHNGTNWVQGDDWSTICS